MSRNNSKICFLQRERNTKYEIRNTNKGFILLLTLIFMVTLTVLVGALLYMVTYETRDMGSQVEDYKLLNLAEAGVQKAMRAIRDDVLATSQQGTAYLRGADTTGSVSVGNVARIRYIGEPTGTATINNNNDRAFLSTFDANYTNTTIISVSIGVRASRAGGGTGATIEVAYTTDGLTYAPAITQALTTNLTEYFSANIALTWPAIMNSNFRLRARRTAGDRNINLDALYLRVTYQIDTLTESWATGSYATFPISLGSGTVQSISITAEQGKVHLNTASLDLVTNLLQECGVVTPAPATLATNVINYRALKKFDSVEELMQVTGMTGANYDLIKDFVTVYSFINPYVQRPTGSPNFRAPVNINTADPKVLRAVFDSLSLGTGDPAQLAADIVTFRTVTPFSCFYSFNSAVTTDFYDFVRSRPYLSTAGDPDEEDRVLDNADASSLVPVAGSNGFNAVTTEFCYDTNAFKVESLADISGRRIRIKTILGHNGSHTFTTFNGDTASIGYRKENFE